MTVKKERSTIQQNKRFVFDECPIAYAMDRIGGYWKPIILYHLLPGSKRYSEIKKAIPAITEKMLIQHLRQLENDRLVIREAKPVVPPHVTYSLSSSGKALQPVLFAMAEWVIEDSKLTSKKIKKDLKDFAKQPLNRRK